MEKIKITVGLVVGKVHKTEIIEIEPKPIEKI